MKKKTFNKIPVLPLSHQLIWWICRGITLVWGVVMLFSGYTTEFLEAIFGIIFMHLWELLQWLGGKTFITLVPYRIQTMLNVLICFGIVVGTTINKFTSFEHIDIPEHFMSGFIAAVGSYELAVIIQGKQPHDRRISPAVAAIFSLACGVMLMTGWEFYEFTMDRLYGLNMQQSYFNTEAGLIDTMTDLIIGATGSIAGMFYNVFSKHNIKRRTDFTDHEEK